jgi:uncharacterized protein YgiM (DUF1202 family)
MFTGVLVALLLIFSASVELADAQRTVRVRGHYRKDGTYVPPHYRTAPNGTTLDNWSTRGNVNPYTGEVGTRDPGATPPARWSTPASPPRLLSSGRPGTFYLHGRMNLRSGPGTEFPILRTLPRGARLQLGEEASGWAWVEGEGGYIYRASSLVRSAPPSMRSTRPAPRVPAVRHPAGASAICRDGTYSYSRNRSGTCSHHGGVRIWL